MTTTTTTKAKELPENLKQFEGMSPEAIIQKLGGDQRGAISNAIRSLISMGATKGQTAALLAKRFQHVRNVLANDIANANRPQRPSQHAPAPITLPTVAFAEPKIEPKIETAPTTPAPKNLDETKKAGPAGGASVKGGGFKAK